MEKKALNDDITLWLLQKVVVILEWSLVELLTYNISQRAKLANVTTRPRGHRSQGSGVLTEGLKYELKKKKKKTLHIMFRRLWIPRWLYSIIWHWRCYQLCWMKLLLLAVMFRLKCLTGHFWPTPLLYIWTEEWTNHAKEVVPPGLRTPWETLACYFWGTGCPLCVFQVVAAKAS